MLLIESCFVFTTIVYHAPFCCARFPCKELKLQTHIRGFQIVNFVILSGVNFVNLDDGVVQERATLYKIRQSKIAVNWMCNAYWQTFSIITRSLDFLNWYKVYCSFTYHKSLKNYSKASSYTALSYTGLADAWFLIGCKTTWDTRIYVVKTLSCTVS